MALFRCAVERLGLEYFPFDKHEVRLTIGIGEDDEASVGSGFLLAMQNATYMSPDSVSRSLFESHKSPGASGLPDFVVTNESYWSNKWDSLGSSTDVGESRMSATIVLKVVMGRDFFVVLLQLISLAYPEVWSWGGTKACLG